MEKRRPIPPFGKPNKTEAAYSYLMNKYIYIQRKITKFTIRRRRPPKTLGRPSRTEGGGTA